MSGTAETRFRLRVCYQKTGRCAYLGHLEVMHTVERIVRRAGLPYAVTQGFSPRMKASFSTALPVGTSSECEYFDLYLTELVPAASALERLRAAAPPDLAPGRAAYVELARPALTAEITRVGYRCELWPTGGGLGAGELDRALCEVRAAGAIPFRRGKKSKTLDLERFLLGARVRAGEGRLVLELDTRTTNDGSLRPEVLLAALDRELRGVDVAREPIESTGVQEYGSFARVAICRSFQRIEAEDGALEDPLPAPPARSEPPLSARA